MDKLKDKLAKKLVINDIQVSSPHPNQDDFEVLSFIVYNLINEAVEEERKDNIEELDQICMFYNKNNPIPDKITQEKRDYIHEIIRKALDEVQRNFKRDIQSKNK